MTLGLSRRSAILLLAGVLLVGNLGFYLWYRATAQQRKNGMESRRIELIREVEVREKEEATFGSQRARLSEVSSTLDEFYGKRAGLARDNLAPIVLEIHTLMQDAGILPASISYANHSLTDLPLSEMQVSFSFRNDYNRFKKFLGAIELDRRWIAVREISLNRDPDIPGSVQVHMTLATYFAKGDSAPPVQTANAKKSGPRAAGPPSSSGAFRQSNRSPDRAAIRPASPVIVPAPAPGRPAVGSANRAAPAAGMFGGPPPGQPAAAPKQVRP